MRGISILSSTKGCCGVTRGIFTSIPCSGFAILAAMLWRLIFYYPFLVMGTLVLPKWMESNKKKWVDLGYTKRQMEVLLASICLRCLCMFVYLLIEPNERFCSSFFAVMLSGFLLVETFTGRSLFISGSVTGRFTCGIGFVTLLPGTTLGVVGYLA